MAKLETTTDRDKPLAFYLAVFGALGVLESVYYFSGWLLLQSVIIFIGAYLMYRSKPVWTLLAVLAACIVLVPFVPNTPRWPVYVLLAGWVIFWLVRIVRKRNTSIT